MATNDIWDRDHILANFQAATGNDDISKCIEILESHKWDMQLAMNSFFQEEELPSNDRPISVDGPPGFFMNDDIPTRDTKQLNFEVSWHGQVLLVSLDETETVEDLKRGLNLQLGIPISDINLESWPCDESTVKNKTVLSSLNLPQTTHLVLLVPPKVTVSPAQFLPCNISSGDSDRPISVGERGQSSKSFDEEITLNINHSGRDYRMSFKTNQTVKEVKLEVYPLIKVSSRNQEWHGWPDNTTDNSRLCDLGLSHDQILIVTSREDEASSSQSLYNKPPSESEAKGSVGDTDDIMIHDDYDDDAIFDSDASSTRKLKTLLPRNSSDDADAMIQFQQNFEERYGEVHPHFYIGPLKNAIDEAAGSNATERRPLLVYLHHDNSILSNIFCSQILCSQQLVSFVSQNFVIWSWDVTDDTNRQRFVNMLVVHFGNSAANTVSKYRDADYPLLLIVMKSKAGLEVCSILQANASLDEVMMSLIQGYEVFEQTKLVEIKNESERLERDLMKQEQDDAYNMSLAADRAKVEAEKMRQDEENKKLRKAQLDEDMKEAERVSCAEQLADEPPAEANNTTNIRFRFPNGDRTQRRFYEHEKLNVIFMYVTSKGFNTSEHRIVTNFPRAQLTEESLQRSLKEMKLCPQQNLFVEEI